MAPNQPPATPSIPFPKVNKAFSSNQKNVLAHHTTTNNCSFNVKIHTPPDTFLDALQGNQPNTGEQESAAKAKADAQAKIEEEKKNAKKMSMMQKIDTMGKDFHAANSSYYSDASLPNLHPTAAKNFRLLLSSGTITLQRLPYGQTSFTFSTQLTLGEVKKKGISSSSSIRATVLGRISSKTLVESITSRAKRVAGTANESVEKYFHKPERGGAAVGMTVAKMDLSAIRLVAELWLLDTYAEKIDLSDRAIMEVWHNLDGTRGQQYATSIGLPGGFQDRLFKTWFTWEKTIDGGSRRTFIIALAPLKTYEGTHHEVAGAEKMMEATSKGMYIIKELSENTCE
ncbi:hypothetical protein TL16_g08210 [Triparma laevis f. inornata]|uniref:Uncharacterized protein n=1 Tax=Triparma laevis f. inornata TaxID=1714386 RepID=A0A9W7EHZ8_9STRA|nr:hypothetical protein TL16_g08210 [Triparma laevis f. inornata]